MKLLLLLFSGVKASKLLLSAGSMVLSVFAYALLFGWKYAMGLVFLILIHELGHYLAARQRGLNVGLPTFIPFLGAWIELKEQPMDAETEAYVAMAGPVLGSLAAFACYLLFTETGERMLLALAFSGFMLNLFNLIPLRPLDGGRIVGVVSTRIWYLGIPLLLGLFFWRPSPILLVVVVCAAPGVIRMLRGVHAEGEPYFAAPLNVRIGYGVQYLLLVLFLALISFQIHEQLGAAGV